MKLSEGIKEKGLPFYIPDCSRDELPDFLVQMGYKTGVEIGVYKGEFTEKFCKEGLKMYAIDPWIAFSGQGRDLKRQERQDFLYEYTKGILSSYPNCTIIRKTSMDAYKDFHKDSLDFVYIDGDHSFRCVAEDIYEWFWRVRKGGIIAGHDYYCTDPWARNLVCQVKPVVDAFVKCFQIESFWTFGRTKPIEEENKDDKYLSWCFFKP